MCRDVLRKFLHEIRVNHFRLIVRHAFIKTRVKRQKMAGGAGIREFWRSHQLAAGNRPGLRQRFAISLENYVAVHITHARPAIFRFGISYIRIRRARSMAIHALELHHRSGWTTSNRSHVQRVVQFDRPAVTWSCSRSEAKRRELRMTILETANLFEVFRFAICD